MALHKATIGSEGQLTEALHIKPGTRFAVFREGNHIILRPVDKRFIDELCGITAGGPSGTEMLLKERRKDHKRARW